MSTKTKTIDYYALTDAEKRVAIARDVLSRLNARKIRARSGTYFETHWGPELPSGDLRETLTKRESQPVRPCEVCALGGLFYSQVMLGNGVTLRESRRGLLGDEEIKTKLAQVFDQQQMREIETAFEGNEYEDFGGSTKALVFHAAHGYEPPEKIMRAIMKNIVRNRGTFVP